MSNEKPAFACRDHRSQLSSNMDNWSMAVSDTCPKIGLPHLYWPQGTCQYCGETAPILAARNAEIIMLRDKAISNAQERNAAERENARLREELAATYEELIEHNGDSLDDDRAKRVAALKEKASD